MGPMRAAREFAAELKSKGLLAQVERVRAELYGSLALTGKGHGTDRAILLGLGGEEAATIDPESIEPKLVQIRETGSLRLAGITPIRFVEREDLLFHTGRMFPENAVTQHPNGVRFTALGPDGRVMREQVYFSIGGGFIIADGEESSAEDQQQKQAPYSFSNAAGLLEVAANHHLSIPELMMANESAWRNRDEVRAGVLQIWKVMRECMERGIATEGILPGGLNVRRRAPRLAKRLADRTTQGDPLAPLDWVTVYAMAVNEENAAGGRVVTAPTNGAAGVIPAVAQYYSNFIDGADDDGILRYFLTSAAIGILYKENASISGAEVGCQGEVGVACSMAAGGLVAALNGTNEQVEHAAEIAMEHNLGMTCDPIGGLVQIPCIERNAMGAVKAVHACRMAMHETEGHKVSLDQVIRTMYLTGLDMQSRYKETSLAGLALNVIEC